MHIQNSSQLWDKIWKKTPGQFPGSSKLESLYRRVVYFSAFDTLLGLVSPSGHILELGSGTGRNSTYLAKRYSARSVTLLDFSESALARAREEDFSCALIKIQQDLLRFTPQKQYEFVHSTGLIEHFTGQERRAVVRKHAECVAPGGYVMIWVPVRSPAFFLIGQFNKLMGIEEIPLTRQELKTLCAESGLNVIKENSSVLGALYGVLAQKI
ncbi:MAG: class I SAM-dependent methyltransferase [bacterium]|nr:class I SAM-dependent methyltransferase [bacterium]